MNLKALLKSQMLLNIVLLTALFCLAKWFVHSRKWEIGAFDPQSGSLLGAVIFIAAFMMAGTLADYRASEEVPEQIVAALETIEDVNHFAATLTPDYNPRPLKAALIEIADAILFWLRQKGPIERVQDAISALNPLFVDLSKATSPPILARLQGEQAKVRLIISKVQRIRDTDFVPAAYVLLQVLFLGSAIILLLLGGKDFIANLVVSAVLFAAFAYLIALIRDLDDPFEYDGESGVDIDLSLLLRAQERLERR